MRLGARPPDPHSREERYLGLIRASASRAPAAAIRSAVVAAARKLARLFWCMRTRGQDYAYARRR
jgi:hypothetical protein